MVRPVRSCAFPGRYFGLDVIKVATGRGAVKVERTMLVQAVSLLLFPAVMAFAASTDLFTMKISNRIPIVLAVGFLGLALLDRMALVDIGNHFAAGFVVLIVSFVFFSRGWIGGGDAKLAAATALWFGWTHLGDYLLVASLLGGVLTFLILEFRRRDLPPVLAGQVWLARLHEPNGGVPYGIALAAAALIVYPYTSWMIAMPSGG
jgi:prepilin peptidase CpaA